MDAEPVARKETFSGVTLLNEDASGVDLSKSLRRGRKWTVNGVLVPITLVLAVLAFIFSVAALFVANGDDDGGPGAPAAPLFARSTNRRTERKSNNRRTEGGLISRKKLISRIAFGSCTTYWPNPQPIWTKAIIPSNPDAWIWLGDFIYMDNAPLNCLTNPKDSHCKCPTTPVSYPPVFCGAANISNAREKAEIQLMDPDYQEFLQHMCPQFNTGLAFPPEGSECEKPIIGTYDDHDFGWNNGHRYMRDKVDFKNLFLDALGEPRDSVRRSSTNGLQYKYTLNADQPVDRTIDVFVLDQRYERDPLPCGVRRDWCERILNGTVRKPHESDTVWCEDFLNTGGPLGDGSCCKADDEWANGWCKKKKNSKDPLWDVACDPSSVRFGSMLLEVDSATNALTKKKYNRRNAATETSMFCDLMGLQQRRWFQNSLEKSDAPLKIVVSGSVPFGNPVHEGDSGRCSGDDFECYKVAQENFAHTIARVDKGCVVVLTGDFHMSDIKVLKPGDDTPYSEHYPTNQFKKTVYQVMSSGLTPITAIPRSILGCRGYVKDRVGLRPFGRCSVVMKPSFGIMEIDWDARRVSLSLRASNRNSITRAVDKSRQELVFDLDTCETVED